VNATYKKLLKKLHEKYPGKHISISLANDYYSISDKYDIEYFVYVEDVESKYQPTLSDVKVYVKQLCQKGG